MKKELSWRGQYVESPQQTNHKGTVVGCVSEYDTQHRGTNTAVRFEVVKVLWDKGVSDSWTQLLILLL